MRFEAIDHVIFPTLDLTTVTDRLARIGLHVSRSPDFAGGFPSSRALVFGESANLFRVELATSTPMGRDDTHPLTEMLTQAIAVRPGFCAVVLRVHQLEEQLREWEQRGVPHELVMHLRNPSDQREGKIVRIPVEDAAGVPLVLVEYPSTADSRFAEVEMIDALNHRLTIRRLDHLAAIAHHLDAATHYWTHTLGIPLFGEVRTPTMVIRQFKIGDAILELLGPATADSPIHQRPPGLISMMSLEVSDLAEVSRQVRTAGFPISDPAKGVLPGTITATVQGTETGGITLQFLQYDEKG